MEEARCGRDRWWLPGLRRRGALGRPDQTFCPVSGSRHGSQGPLPGLFSLAMILTPFSSPLSRAAGPSSELGSHGPTLGRLAAGAGAVGGLGLGAGVWWNLVPRKTVSSGGECMKAWEQKARRDCWGQRGAKELPSERLALFCSWA